MRYDVTFKIGDYVGPLNYKFTGDDDLWVVLDGKKIVIDLGGIHSAATGNVDLWNYIGQAANLTEAQKQQTHTLTILYMERGAGASNCEMKFTLPSAKIQQVDKTKMTNISFYKTDAEGNGLPGAQFSLTNDATQATMLAASESDGLVQFQQLVAGTYTLTETPAPKDYVTPTTSWKVKVTADHSGDLSARIYLADGTELGTLTSGEYQIINSASTPVQPPTPGIVETKKELSHEKYIAKNKDGTYNLTLNVSGAVGSESYANKLDVLFVMDTSNSMMREMNSKNDLNDYTTNENSRFFNQQKAVEAAVAKLKSKKNVDAQFAVVSFDTQAGIETEWTKDSIKYPTGVGKYPGYSKQAGGTNYEAGLIKAKQLLDSGRTDATKIVVFLSDGDPTFYYKKDSQGNITGIGGGKGNSYNDTAMVNAQTQLSKMSMNYFYTVGVGPEDSYNHLSSLISNAPSGTVTGSYNGTDSSNLKNAFDSIIRDATELLCTDVTVTDTLTDEVELVNQNLQVVVKDETGKVITKLKDASGNEAARRIRMKSKTSKLMIGIIFLAGLSLLLYPFVANQWNNYRQKQLISSYEQTVSEKDAAHEIDYDAELQKAEAYNEALLPSILPDSFAVAATSDKEDQSYMDALNIAGDEMMGIVEIPKIDIKLPIYHTTDENVLKQAAGHLEGSSLPIGGKSTHAVISAHRGLPSASLFTDLDQLEEGDHFLIHVLNETLCYEVDKISVVKPEETSSLAVEEGKDLVTLLTCTPYGVNTERLLVRGHRVPYVKQEVADEKTPLSGISLHTNYLLWVIIGLVITTIFILMLYLKEKKLQKKKNETS